MNSFTQSTKHRSLIPLHSLHRQHYFGRSLTATHAQTPHRRYRLKPTSSTASTTTTTSTKANRSHETDYVVIGSGIGGLSCAALLARYGYSVTVCEAHYHAGGAAHGFEVNGYEFDAGPSFFAGLSGAPGKSSNPLKQVLDAVGENVDCITYNKWIVYTPEGTFPCVCDSEQYAQTILKIGGRQAYTQWKQLEAAMHPLGAGAALFPAAAIRSDPGIILSASRFGPALLKTAFMVGQLTGPFSNIVDPIVTDPWLRSFIDLECFVLSGMMAKDTIAAEMLYMYYERNGGKSTIDYPMGGSRAIVDALVRGIEKHGGKVVLRAPVEEIVIDSSGRAAGVKLAALKSKRGAGASGGEQKQQPNEVIKARKAVISNASVWDTPKLLPSSIQSTAGYQQYTKQAKTTARTGSFMHLHLGIDATGLPADLECHHLIVNDWSDLEAPQNVCIVSIPTVFDPSFAPEGCATIHAYTAGNEPWELWQDIEQGTPEYEALKEERSQCLWRALERIIPDIRDRIKLKLVGSPLTHQRFLNRHKGTYGAAISAREGSFPGPQTGVAGLYRCGDSCQPGIGVPAAAASGMICANTLAPVWSHLELLDALKL